MELYMHLNKRKAESSIMKRKPLKLLLPPQHAAPGSYSQRNFVW